MKKLTLNGPITMNCYIIDYNGKCFIVDPGYDDKSIKNYVDDNGLEVVGILLTHGHPDHIGGIHCYDVPIYLHEKDEAMILHRLKADHNSPRFEMTFDYSQLNRLFVEDKTMIPFDDKEIRVIHTPGHSEGGVCYVFENELFSGDTLFCQAVGRWDFATGDLASLKDSVVKLIDESPDTYKVHPGHGESTTIGSERRLNPYYNQWRKEQ